MSEEELEDLLGIGCCRYHEEIGEKAKKEIERLNKELEEKEAILGGIQQLEAEIERLKTKEEQLIRRLEDLIIVGEQVENEWAIDICKMVINELKGSENSGS